MMKITFDTNNPKEVEHVKEILNKDSNHQDIEEEYYENKINRFTEFIDNNSLYEIDHEGISTGSLIRQTLKTLITTNPHLSFKETSVGMIDTRAENLIPKEMYVTLWNVVSCGNSKSLKNGLELSRREFFESERFSDVYQKEQVFMKINNEEIVHKFGFRFIPKSMITAVDKISNDIINSIGFRFGRSDEKIIKDYLNKISIPFDDLKSIGHVVIDKETIMILFKLLQDLKMYEEKTGRGSLSTMKVYR